MTTVAFIEPDLSRHWVKRLARKMGVPVETARHWVYKRMPDARRQEIALALLAECDRLEALIADTRRRWGEVADDETARSVARRQADRDGAPSRGVGIEVRE